MFVRQLIGSQAGQIIDLPYHAATACLAGGTVAAVTDDEVKEAGLEPEDDFVSLPPDEIPAGFRIEEDTEGPGYNVFDASGFNLTTETAIPHRIAAREFIMNYLQLEKDGRPTKKASFGKVEQAEAQIPVVPTSQTTDVFGATDEDGDSDDEGEDIPEDWRDLHHTKQIALAKKFDSKVSTKGEAVAALEAEEAKRSGD